MYLGMNGGYGGYYPGESNVAAGGAGLGAMFRAMGQAKVNAAEMQIRMQQLQQAKQLQDAQIAGVGAETALKTNRLKALNSLGQYFRAAGMPDARADLAAGMVMANGGADMDKDAQGMGRFMLQNDPASAIPGDAMSADVPLFKVDSGTMYNQYNAQNAPTAVGGSMIGANQARAADSFAGAGQHVADANLANATIPLRYAQTQNTQSQVPLHNAQAAVAQGKANLVASASPVNMLASQFMSALGINPATIGAVATPPPAGPQGGVPQGAGTQPVGAVAGRVPGPQAIQYLKSNPASRAQFEASFPGYSASTYLGQ